MSNVGDRRNPVITAWSAVSPFGFGQEAFIAGVGAGQSVASLVDTEKWPVPDSRACMVPGFSIAEHVGAKGTRAMNRVTGLSVTLLSRFVGGDSGGLPNPAGERTGLVLGTTAGSLHSGMDFTRVSMTAKKPTHVDPASVPTSVMNSAAGQCAIRLGLKGPNATIAGGRAAGLLGLSYARRLLSNGRADTVLCGSVEEFSVERSWLEHHLWAPAFPDRKPIGEGGAAFRLELADQAAGEPVAELVAVASRVAPRGKPGDALTAAVQEVVKRADTDLADVWSVVSSGFSASDEESQALVALFGADVLDRIPDVAALIGDTGAASAAFGVAAVLAAVHWNPGGRGRLSLVTAIDPDGLVVVAALRPSAASA